MAVIIGTEGNDVLIGTPGDDTIDGRGGSDVIAGGDGNDTLIGGPDAANELIGGPGDDLYYVSVQGDTVYEAAGEGNDTVRTALNSYTLPANLENLIFTGAGDFSGVGNDQANLILGGSGNDVIDGGLGADSLAGGDGNDTLIGGSGAANELIGGKGDDLYFVSVQSDTAFELAGEGNDMVRTALGSYALGANLENLVFTGTGDFVGVGNDQANLILGGSGNDVIDGGLGADSLAGGDGSDTLIGGSGAANELIGGKGDDTYFVSVQGDTVYEATGEGNDTVRTALGSYALAANLENLVFTGAGTFSGTGNDLANLIVGGSGNDVIDGGLGADGLSGGAGNDTLIGGSGAANELVGGTGDDIYIVSVQGDTVYEAAGEGNDTVRTALAAYTLGSNLENLVFTGAGAFSGTGNDLANLIVGGSGNDVIDGGLGADGLSGGAGNDTLIGGSGAANELVGGMGDDTYVVSVQSDTVYEAAGEGNDTVRTALAAYTLGSNLENLVFTGAGAFSGTGNTLANTLTGGAGNDSLAGLEGSDTLTGGGGSDTFAFTTALGAGNVDTILDFAPGVDKIVLAGGPGDPFALLATGALGAGSFVNASPDPYAGAALPSPGGSSQISAADSNDYILYNRSSGALLYDADGNGAGAAVQFATLQPGLNLTAADFIVSGPANNAPTVTSGASASVAENSPASTIVYQAAASDADGDRVTWSLSGTDATLLTIDANGAVRLIASADFETKATYSFNVVASDSATSTPKAVTLTITDVADVSTPIISETSAANDTIGTAQAIDRGIFTVSPNGNLFNPSLPSATIQGSVSAPGDTDFFSITLQAGELLVLDVDIDPANGLDSFLALFGPNQFLIGDNDDLISHDPGSGTQFGHNTDSQIRFRAAVSGTYYFSIASFSDEHGPTSSGAYSLNVSIGPPATPQQLIQEDIDALVSGESWNHLNLTYGFPTLASQYPSNPQEVQNGFTPFTMTQQTATSLIVQLIANVTPLTFQQLTANPGTADLRYAMSNEPDVAYAYYPTNGGPSSLGGTAWFNHTNFNSPQQGNYAWMGILHETGHALGLKHGHEFPVAISADRDSVEYSVMTYRSYPGQDLSDGGGYSNETTSYPQTLMMYDIAALQQMYGANYAFNNTDSIYTWSPTTGRMMINGAAATTPAGNHVFLTVWDGGGNDTYDLSNYTASDTLGATTIDLRPGEWSTISQVQIANLGDGHMARGNVANALLYQGNTASLIENAIGSQAADTIIANQVANHLTGNGAADTFKWTASTDSAAGAQADTIMDFVSGSDHIDLSVIDANPATGTNDAFTFIGTAAFHNVAGELRYDVTGGNAHVFADLDGNGVADFEIIVNNVATLTSVDFVL